MKERIGLAYCPYNTDIPFPHVIAEKPIIITIANRNAECQHSTKFRTAR